jgi:hypothetical protein
MYLTVKMVLFGWRFKGAHILTLRINAAFSHLCRTEGNISVSINFEYMYIRLHIVDKIQCN